MNGRDPRPRLASVAKFHLILSMHSVYDVGDFSNDVLERSYRLPVLVDFWAEWCGPCKVLGPVLERLAAKANGEWVLAKLDTEQFPDLAGLYNIRGIPAVKLFVDGAVSDEFVGALPEYQVEHWLRQALPDRFRKRLQTAERLVNEGKAGEAQAEYEAILKDDPSHPEAKVRLARLILPDNPRKAEELVHDLEEPAFQEMIDAVRTVAHLSAIAGNPDHLPPGAGKEAYLRGARALTTGMYPEALREFIDVIRNDRPYDDDGARKACIAIFKILGEEHPTTREYRRDFSSALY